MKSLIIGAEGFVGRHLRAELAAYGDVFATERDCGSERKQNTFVLDICDKENMAQVLASCKPDVIYHLAAQSSVALSWKSPEATVNANILGTLHLLECVRQLDYRPRVLLIGSSEEYGKIAETANPIVETTLCKPENIYAITKCTQNQLGTLYARAYGMDIVLTRTFNCIGVGQSEAFVVPSFAAQLADIAKQKRKPVIRVGNLSARRDFTDVRDVVRAYRLLAEKGTAGETYNVGSGKAQSVHSLLEQLIALSGLPVTVEVAAEKYRPVDLPLSEADITKLQAATAWQPTIPLSQTLREVLEWKME